MPRKADPHLIVDVFAGPGGLGEGFLSLKENGTSQFEGALSIEHDNSSHATLTLRHFVRAFDEMPENYYRYLEGAITLDDLYRAHPNEHRRATTSSLKITLGPDSHSQVRGLLTKLLGGQTRWALVGGPPCQAYSLVGRSRMARNPAFEQDERHFLYREYLKIIADHRPPVFVMENVKGLLSATVDGVSMITRIVSDLQEPVSALKGREDGLRYRLRQGEFYFAWGCFRDFCSGPAVNREGARNQIRTAYTEADIPLRDHPPPTPPRHSLCSRGEGDGK